MSSFRSDEAMHSLCAGCEEGEFAEGCEMGEFAEADTDAWTESKIEESVAEIITAFPRVQHARITPDSDGDSIIAAMEVVCPDVYTVWASCQNP